LLPFSRVAGSHHLHAEAPLLLLLLLPLLLLLLAAGDVLLVGIDRRNHPAQVEAAYNDKTGALKHHDFAKSVHVCGGMSMWTGSTAAEGSVFQSS
jgi:hypothetical protein